MAIQKKTYVGYTNNLNKRLKKHNSNLGAKSTKGYKWEIIYKKKFYSKSKALSFEYKLKKDRKERLRLLYELKKNLNIATILPYKENYTFNKASAASLWVSEFFKKSKYKKNNIIYGHTKSKDYLSKNYKNINLKNLKSKLKSTTNEYAEKLTKEINNNNFDIVEIHNRPQLFFKLINKVKSKFIFYFHNDPLSMKGSKSVKERLKILENVEKIIFVSEWVRERFFLDIDQKLQTKTEVVYPSVNKQKKIKKEKNIIFVGRLNYSKGYDIFKDAIIKILNKFPKWKAYSLGDEDRRNIYINHPNHKELGFLNHKKTLNI